MKTITTGTKITFTETGDKFELIQTPTGFDVKRIKLSKNITPEPYTFQELLDLYEAAKITIHGFEEGDAALVKSILTNYIHTTEIEALKADVAKITGEKEELEASKGRLDVEVLQLKSEILILTNKNSDLIPANEKLITDKAELENSNKELAAANKELEAANKELKATNQQLNTTIEAMQEK